MTPSYELLEQNRRGELIPEPCPLMGERGHGPTRMGMELRQVLNRPVWQNLSDKPG